MNDAEGRADAAAKWLVEALESGSPLAPLPPELAPGDTLEGAEIVAALLEQTGHLACGVRILRRSGQASLAGPVIEGRILPGQTPVALAALRHASATAALVGVLAEALEPDSEAAPVFARLHPAIDLAATRFTELPPDAATCTADLALLGYLVVGRARAPAAGDIRVSLGEAPRRQRGLALDLDAAFGEAAAAARALGGLPAGALLVVAGLTEPVPPVVGQEIVARFTGLGKAVAGFV